MSKQLFTAFLLVGLFTACGSYNASTPPPLNTLGIDLSQELLSKLRAKQDVTSTIGRLAELTPQDLKAELDTRDKQLAFWINIYNGMVQYLLTNQPALWEKRGKFFSGSRIILAGKLLSLEDIEHGIIRGGEGKLGLGYVPKLFPSKFERTFCIPKGDPRVHFALNCGAIDCPPVEIYDPQNIADRLDHRTRVYLKKHSAISADGHLVTTPLFSWFKGDYNTYGGVDDFLVHFGILTEENKKIKRKYKAYDWTLATNVYAID